jgi:hypothetical protein
MKHFVWDSIALSIKRYLLGTPNQGNRERLNDAGWLIIIPVGPKARD